VSGDLERGTPRARLWADRCAARLVGMGGLAVVASLAGMLVFLVNEVAPLIAEARVETAAELAPLRSLPAAAAVDPHGTHLAALGADGVLRVHSLADGEVVKERSLLEQPALLARTPGRALFAAATGDGRIAAAEVEWTATFEGRKRVVASSLSEPQIFSLDTRGARVRAVAVEGKDGRWLAAAVLDDGRLQVVAVQVETNDFTGERSERRALLESSAPRDVTHVLVEPLRRIVFGATADGNLLYWEVVSGEMRGPHVHKLPSPATALAMAQGGRALLVGHADGTTSEVFRVPFGEARLEWARVRGFAALPAAVEQIEASQRDRSFLARAADGTLGLFHATTGEELWRGPAPLAEPGVLVLSPRGNAAFLLAHDTTLRLRVWNPHPEAGWRGLLTRIWYEDHPGPAYVWQSTGGTDASEPKLSLVPLVVGTLKGTLYALLLAIPLGMGGAIFVSQFMHARIAGVVKPVVELMAALPSVVLGFVAGLWLAPRLERLLPGFLAMVLCFPLVALASGALWRALPRAWTQRWPAGVEVSLHGAALVLGAWACVQASPWLEARFFGGDTAAWLQQTTGLVYDQRNAIVAGIAMGFAVIPIVLSLSDDALSNVPASLSAASLALGATRWQTVARVVLPAASPGLFAAVMIALGRAIGETMIVLMATGNTPVLGWGPFDGFRTLSANIAVEIPEAPHGGTLYRVLFVSALALFAVTFALNTAAELVRERLRRRFSGS
jgi:phosphate transport system permease protein